MAHGVVSNEWLGRVLDINAVLPILLNTIIQNLWLALTDNLNANLVVFLDLVCVDGAVGVQEEDAFGVAEDYVLEDL